MNGSWEDLGDGAACRWAPRSGTHPGMQLAHRCSFLWFYYYKCAVAPSHSGESEFYMFTTPFPFYLGRAT